MQYASKTLTELESEDWGDPPEGSGFLVDKCYRLRKVPIGDLSVENLRMLIGQHIGLRWLIPIALKELEHSPCASGDFYDGALLENVQAVPDEYWGDHSDQAVVLAVIVNRAREIGCIE